MSRRVLVVEDSPTQAEALTDVLTTAGYQVACASTGEAGLSQVETGEWDIVISDIVMPGAMDGYELCRRIKAGSQRETPVVLLTSLADPLDIIKGLECGADNFFIKPFDGAHLLGRLNLLLDTRLARSRSRLRVGVKVFFMGREFTIASEREQILDLLISTFEDAVRQNHELRAREAELEAARAELVRYAGSLETDLKRFFDLTVDMICVAGSDGYFKRLNPAWQRWLGWTTEELLARPYIEFLHPDDRVGGDPVVATLTRGAEMLAFQNRLRCKDGSYRWIEWRAIPLPDDAMVYAVARDVTERNLLEGQVRHAQKMESIGQLAGGVAHDFNNLLTVIIAESDRAGDSLAKDHPAREALSEVRRASERAAGLTRQLLAFSRQQIVEPVVCVINDIVVQTDRMLRRLIGEHVAFQTTPAPGLGAVRMDVGQLEQVLVNLAVNARDAMPDGGKLTVETANVTLDEEYTSQHAHVQAGEYVLLAVSDNGVGMNAEVKQRIFEPFFTTKGPGKGTGLGLATCYGIVKQAGGHIEVYSELGVGTTFKVYLPRVEARAAPDRRRTVSVTNGAGEAILMVEDDDGVRRVATRILESKGYKVMPVDGFAAALPMLSDPTARIDLLLTDLVLPDITGSQLAERARELRPGLRVLFMSGYTHDASLRNRILRKRDELVHKPFTAESLSAKVREVLDAEPADRDGEEDLLINR